MKYYVVYVLGGKEVLIKERIKRTIKREGVSQHFGKMIILTEKVIAVVKNKRTVVQKKIAPSYILIEMEDDLALFSIIRKVEGVMRFLGDPTPLKQEEVDKMLTRIEAKPHLNKGIACGDSVQIKEGPFKDFVGVVKEINDKRAKVEVSILGREVLTELDPLIISRAA
jgi:transcription termination/antitermination protein NusG